MKVRKVRQVYQKKEGYTPVILKIVRYRKLFLTNWGAPPSFAVWKATENM